jgi:hypothetical protein
MLSLRLHHHSGEINVAFVTQDDYDHLWARLIYFTRTTSRKSWTKGCDRSRFYALYAMKTHIGNYHDQGVPLLYCKVILADVLQCHLNRRIL